MLPRVTAVQGYCDFWMGSLGHARVSTTLCCRAVSATTHALLRPILRQHLWPYRKTRHLETSYPSRPSLVYLSAFDVDQSIGYVELRGAICLKLDVCGRASRYLHCRKRLAQ